MFEKMGSLGLIDDEKGQCALKTVEIHELTVMERKI